MPLKLNVGLSKKIGLPDYGSIGATCAVELEVDSSLLQGDLEAFHRHVRNAYAACRQAVQDELARHQPGPAAAGNASLASGQATPPAAAAPKSSGNGSQTQASGQDGPGRAQGASEKQQTYLRQLAGQIKGLGVRRLDTVALRMFGKPVAVISSLQASSLIDTLKAIKAGEIDLERTLSGGAP